MYKIEVVNRGTGQIEWQSDYDLETEEIAEMAMEAVKGMFKEKEKYVFCIVPDEESGFEEHRKLIDGLIEHAEQFGEKDDEVKYPIGRGWWSLMDEYIPKFQALDVEVEQLHMKEKDGTLRVEVIAELFDMEAEKVDKITRLVEEVFEKSRYIDENRFT